MDYFNKRNSNLDKNWLIIIPVLFSCTFILLGIIVFRYMYYFTGISYMANVILKLFIWLSIVSFLICWLDKKFSRFSNIRFPNSILLFMAAASGGIASHFARNTFRHKTRTEYDTRFKIVEITSFIIYLMLFIAVC